MCLTLPSYLTPDGYTSLSLFPANEHSTSSTPLAPLLVPNTHSGMQVALYPANDNNNNNK